MNIYTIIYTINIKIESEASQALMFGFDNAFPEKSCFVVDLIRLKFGLESILENV